MPGGSEAYVSFQNFTSTPGFVTWRLARRVVFVYTRPGEKVIDFDADLQLRDAASAGRGYLPITEPAEGGQLVLSTCADAG
ncbi:hypothetical protein ABN028_29080 [Actinopolymorpha sp. B17G11]|uniref:hypothetical protein n=1 Tax=Actinopolymorpha sp. B17G11 TaxID=3160861 RepID=UPI0032E4CDDA